MLKIRICAENENSAALFARLMMPALESVTGNNIVAAVICHESDNYFSSNIVKVFIPVDSWCFGDAAANVRSLAQAGINLMVLSEAFLDRQSVNEFINEELNLFELALAETGMTLIVLEHYNREGKYPAYFVSSEQWPRVHLLELLKTMADDYNNESIVLPWGMLPYFIVQASIAEQHVNPTSIKALIGFQPWSYEKLLPKYIVEKSPFLHWLPVEYASIKTGPVPSRILLQTVGSNI